MSRDNSQDKGKENIPMWAIARTGRQVAWAGFIGVILVTLVGCVSNEAANPAPDNAPVAEESESISQETPIDVGIEAAPTSVITSTIPVTDPLSGDNVNAGVNDEDNDALQEIQAETDEEGNERVQITLELDNVSEGQKLNVVVNGEVHEIVVGEDTEAASTSDVTSTIPLTDPLSGDNVNAGVNDEDNDALQEMQEDMQETNDN